MTDNTYTFRAMNTGIELLVQADNRNASDVQELFTDIQLLFQRVEQTCSRFLPDSELSMLNQMSEVDVPVSPLLYDVLLDAYNAYVETNGVFNPGMLTRLEAAGYQQTLEKVTDSDEEPVFPAGLPRSEVPFELDTHRKTVRLPRGVKIDLGGIAKGWTVDRAVNYLQRVSTGFVNAGGDLRVFGKREEGWKIAVGNPLEPEQQLGVVQIYEGAVATSSTMKRRWKRGAIWMNHLLDPRTGRPTQSPIISATVTAPTAMQADVWAKTVLLLGEEQGSKFIQDQQAQAVLVDRNLHIRSVTNGLG